jgi:hypothetical protein
MHKQMIKQTLMVGVIAGQSTVDVFTAAKVTVAFYGKVVAASRGTEQLIFRLNVARSYSI